MKKSFTLLELLIVIVIIAIITVLAIPQYQNFTIRARGVEAMRMLRALSDSLWRYYLVQGKFPEATVGFEFRGSPYFIPAANLDVTIPLLNFSRYFIYSYQSASGPPFIPNQLQRYAEYKAFDRYLYSDENAPAGAILSYEIWYMYDIPTYEGHNGEKIDQHWYRYHCHTIKEKCNPMPRQQWGWPGES